MADYTLDTCLPFPLTTTIERDTVGTDRTSGFVHSRPVYERGVRVLKWSGEVAEAYAEYFDLLYELTSGGIKNIDYTGPDTGDSFEVCFARQPEIKLIKSKPGFVSLSLELEEVL